MSQIESESLVRPKGIEQRGWSFLAVPHGSADQSRRCDMAARISDPIFGYRVCCAPSKSDLDS